MYILCQLSLSPNIFRYVQPTDRSPLSLLPADLLAAHNSTKENPNPFQRAAPELPTQMEEY
jgi:hypothetical protein